MMLSKSLFNQSCIIILLVNCSLTIASYKIQKLYKIDSIRACRDDAVYPIIPQEFTYRTNGSMIEMNSTFEVTETLEGPFKYKMVINRCDMDFSACGYFNELTLDDICLPIKEPTFGDTWFAGIERNFKCPIVKGFYRFINNVYNASEITNLPAVGYRWHSISTLTAVTKNRTVYCIDMNTRVVRFKARSKQI